MKLILLFLVLITMAHTTLTVNGFIMRAVELIGKMKEQSTIFFPEKVEKSIVAFIHRNGEQKVLQKGSVISKSLLLNKFIYLDEGLIFYAKRTNDYTRPKFVNAIVPERLTDYHLLLEDKCTCCKQIIIARDSKVTFIDKMLINSLSNSDIELFKKFMFSSNYFMERQTALAIFLLTSSPEEKLVKLVFDILTVFEIDFKDEWLKVNIKLTRGEIAGILHISIIKLDLMLNTLRKKGLFKRVGNYMFFNKNLLEDLSPCPLGREDASGCKSNNMLKFKSNNMIYINNY
ncbi:Crp/Fnr family transcriptional regulator [Shewanella sp. 1180_01]|uniref:Crp/Fnr family transcriptional regulator n=1 Tax=Shewanella sp. 1180_01 TaxID=2604451 RepID=UPI0040646576